MTKEFKTTSRGFKIFGEFEDKYKTRVSLVESSEVGRPSIRVYTYDEDVSPDAPFSSCLTLSVEEAKKIIESLQGFVDDAESPENWRNNPEYKKNWG